MGISFFETQMGRKFFSSDVPRLIKALERIADALPIGETTPATTPSYVCYCFTQTEAPDIFVTENKVAAAQWVTETFDQMLTQKHFQAEDQDGLRTLIHANIKHDFDGSFTLHHTGQVCVIGVKVLQKEVS